MFAPEFFFVGILVWLGLRGIRKWVELFITAGTNSDDGSEEKEPEPMSDCVKHMYN
jgi:hypothetical protein